MGELDRFWRGVARIGRLLVDVVLGWRVDLDGIEHIPAGGAVLPFNHHSYVDVVLLAYGPLLLLGRPIRFLAKSELFDHRATRWVVRRAGAVPVRRGEGGRGSRIAAYEAAVDALRADELVAVAPEQTISDSYELLPFRTGAARMAIAASVPIVPVVGWGSQRAFPHHRRQRPRRRLPVVVRYGDPVRARPGESARELTARLRRRMATTLEGVQRGYADRPSPGDDWWQPARLGGSAPSHEHEVRLTEERFDDEAQSEGGEATELTS